MSRGKALIFNLVADGEYWAQGENSLAAPWHDWCGNEPYIME